MDLKHDTVSVKTKQTIMDDTIHTIIALSWEKEYVVESNNFTAKGTPFSFPCLDARNQALCRLYTYLTAEKQMRSLTDAAVDGLWGCGQVWGRKDCALIRNVIRTALWLFQCWLCHCLFPGNKFTTFSFCCLCPCVRQPDISLYNMKLHHTKAPTAKWKCIEYLKRGSDIPVSLYIYNYEIAPNAINMGAKEFLVGVLNLFIYNVHQWMLMFQIWLFNIYIMCINGCWCSKSDCLIYIYNVHQWMLMFQIWLFKYIYNVHQWMLVFQINIYI